MRFALLALHLLSQSPDTSPVAVIHRAMRGVNTDSLRAHYRRLAEREAPAGGYARLGLAELDRLTTSLDDARQGYLAAERIGRQLGDAVVQAEALLGLARVQSRTMPADSVLRTLGRAQGFLGVQPARLGELRCLRGEALLQAGRDGAVREIEAGLSLARRSGALRAIAACWRALGAHYVNSVDDPARSRLPFDSAVAVDRRARDHVGSAESFAGRAVDRFSYLDIAAATADLDSALVYARQTGHRRIEAFVYQTRGQIAFVLGDFPAAVRLQAGVDSTLLGLGDRVSEMHAVMIRGRLAARFGKLDEAEAATRALLASALSLDRPNNIYLARLGLTFIRGAQGDWTGSVAGLDSLIGYMRAHRLDAWISGLSYARGLAQLRQGNLPGAEAMFRAALRNASSGEALTRYQAASRLAEVLARRGEADAAVTTLTGATDELDDYRSRLPDRDLRTLVFQATAAGDEPDLGLATIVSRLAAAGRLADAYRLAERRRARDLSDRLLRAEFASAASDGPVERPRFGVLGREELASLVPDDSAGFVVYVTGRGRQPTTAFVRTRSGLAAVGLPALDSLEPDVNRLNALIRTGTRSDSLRRAIAVRLVDPLLPYLGDDIRHLTIIPDDGLHLLPWDALLLPSGRPLVSRFTTAMAPSLTVAAYLASRPRLGGEARVLALGDPQFLEELPGNSESRGGLYRSAFDATGGLPRLRGSAAEARMASRFGRRSMLRVREDASEAFLKQAPLDSFRVLHVATHALVSEGTPSRTALALSPGGGEDGFVGPGELASLAIGADLVVLSACRTAGGVVVGGEGMQGLTAPLLAAGARAIVATLWPVEDAAVAGFMRTFYDELAGRGTVREALGAAKLAGVERGTPAAVWAAFVLVGDGGATIRLASPRRLGPPAAAAAIAVLLLLYGVMRKRRNAEAA